MTSPDASLVDSFISHLNKYAFKHYDNAVWVDLPEIVCNLCGTKSILPADFKKCIRTINMNITDEQTKILFNKFNSDTSVTFFGYKKNETVITIEEVRRLVKNELLEEQFNYLHVLFQKLNKYYENNLSANNCIYSRFHKDQDLFDTKCIRKEITFYCFKCYNIMLLKTHKFDTISFDDFAQIIDDEWNPIFIKQRDRIINFKHTTKINTDQINQLNIDIKISNETILLLQKSNTELDTKIDVILLESVEKIKSLEDQLDSLNSNALYFDQKMECEIVDLKACNSNFTSQICSIKQIIDSKNVVHHQRRNTDQYQPSLNPSLEHSSDPSLGAIPPPPSLEHSSNHFKKAVRKIILEKQGM